MANKIENKIITIKSFLYNNIIFIPKYQRGYSWGKSNVETFIYDLMENDNYYLGNILIDKHDKTEIIDGQQRIITSILVLSAIRNIEGLKSSFKFDDKLLFVQKKPRIYTEDRESDNGLKLMDYILNDNDVTDNLKKRNEYVQYCKIKKYLKGIGEKQILELYNNLLNCQILVIDSSDYSISPYQIFLNLNTKGLKLSNMDIIKSQIFALLSMEKNFQKIKNEWYFVLNDLKEKQYDDYLSMYANIKLSNQNTKIQKNEIWEVYREFIAQGKDASKEICNDIGSSKGKYFVAYRAVVCGESEKYINVFNDSSIDLHAVFNYFSFLRKINFTQFNISLVSLLFFENEKEKKYIRKEMNLIIKFIKFIFLFAALKSLNNESPSSYGNKFIYLSLEFHKDKKNIKNHISKFVNIFVNKEYELGDLSAFDNKTFEQNTKELKLAVALITFLDEDTICNYNGEHFICNSIDTDDSKSFGNIIPIINDIYGNKSKSDKIKLYNENKTIERHIEIFLLKDCENGECNIEERTKRYKTLFLEQFNKLYNDLK